MAGGFAFERHGFGGVRQDIVCATDFRAKGYFRHGNFNLATPLLFAEYLDLRYVANGDSFANDVIGLASLADGSPPKFLPHAASLQAGGLDELHVARFLCLPGLLRVLVAAAPRLLGASFRASGPPGAFKPYFKGVALRCLYADDGVASPAFLDTLTPPTRPTSYGNGPAKDMSIAWVAKRVGVQPILPVFPNLAGADLSFLDDLEVRLHERVLPEFHRPRAARVAPAAVVGLPRLRHLSLHRARLARTGGAAGTSAGAAGPRLRRPMRVAFTSNHLHGDFSSGRLEVSIAREDARAGVSVADDIYFSVPADFHAHNDLVAAALLTLVGGARPVVSFNFPISSRCAELLRATTGWRRSGRSTRTWLRARRGHESGSPSVVGWIRRRWSCCCANCWANRPPLSPTTTLTASSSNAAASATSSRTSFAPLIFALRRTTRTRTSIWRRRSCSPTILICAPWQMAIRC